MNKDVIVLALWGAIQFHIMLELSIIGGMELLILSLIISDLTIMGLFVVRVYNEEEESKDIMLTGDMHIGSDIHIGRSFTVRDSALFTESLKKIAEEGFNFNLEEEVEKE